MITPIEIEQEMINFINGEEGTDYKKFQDIKGDTSLGYCIQYLLYKVVYFENKLENKED